MDQATTPSDADLAAPSRAARVPVPGDGARFFGETGHAVAGAFLAFLDQYGLGVCGYPLSDVIEEDGVRVQYFQHLALEDVPAGGVRLKALGEAWLALQHARGVAALAGVPAPEVVDLVAQLPRHPTRSYPTRPLADIRYIVLHHTGASRDVGVRAIAAEHVHVNGWPGIAYHYLVGADGTLWRTADITTVTYHARQFNAASVAVALVGDLATSLPGGAQLERTADLVARLLVDLGLPVENVRGHREMVVTPCPGETFLGVWKPRLRRAIEARLSPGRLLPDVTDPAPDVPDPQAGAPDPVRVDPGPDPAVPDPVSADPDPHPAAPDPLRFDPALPPRLPAEPAPPAPSDRE
jgi:hypothetical protein